MDNDKTLYIVFYIVFTILVSFSDGKAQSVIVDSVEEIGMLTQPASVRVRDGGFSILLNDRILWTFGDTFFRGGYVSTDSATYRSNTAALAELSTPLALAEPLDANGTPFPAIPFTPEEQAFNDSAGGVNDRIALWIGGLVPDNDGSALAFFWKLHATGPLTYAPLGVGTAHFMSDSTRAVRDSTLLFSPSEPVFTKAFLHEGMVYLFGGRVPGGLAQPQFLARAPLANATDRSAYTFWNGSAWDPEVNNADTVMTGVSSGLAVDYNAYLEKFTAVYSPPFSNKIVMRTADFPQGPWSSPIELFTGLPPDTTLNVPYNRQGIQHPELAENNGQTIFVSYFRPTGFLLGEMRLAKVTLLMAPAEPMLVSPSDGALNQPTTVAFVWDSASRADAYHFQLSSDPSFATTVIDDSAITGTSRIVTSLANSTTYYWRVRSRNAAGVSSWSAVWRFTTIVALPAAPALAAPSDGATNQPTSLSLSWHPAAGADSYHVQAATDAGFTNLVVNDSLIADTSHAVGSLSNSTTYYWRVRSRNAAGVSSWSPVWRFTTIVALPGAVVLLEPFNGAVIPADSVECIWRQGQPQILRYWFEFASDSLFQNSQVDTSLTATDTVKVLRNLTFNQIYWWRVRAKNAAGWGPFSEIWHFRPEEPVGIEGQEDIPKTFALNQNYPNPFNPATTIAFDLPLSSRVTLEVFDITGRLVRTLVDGQMPAGRHRVIWDGRGEAGQPVASGVYLYRLQAGDFVQTRKMVLMQ